MVSWLQTQFSCTTMCCFPCPQPSVQLCRSDRPDYIHFPQLCKLCRATIQMAFSVYTEKLKDCPLKKKKSLSLYFKDTHTCTHKDLGLHDFVGIAFWLHVPRQDGQKDQDPHVIRCRNFQVNTLSLKPLFIDTHSPLGSDHKNLLPLTTYF